MKFKFARKLVHNSEGLQLISLSCIQRCQALGNNMKLLAVEKETTKHLSFVHYEREEEAGERISSDCNL